MKILAVRPLAERAVTIDLADRVGPDAAACVAAASTAITRALAAGDLPGAEEVAGSFTSVTVHFDCLRISQADLVARLRSLLAAIGPQAAAAGRRWTLPCCYDTADALDLAALSEHLGLSQAAIVAAHVATEFRVYALGFLPGLPFMGDLPPALAVPRRAAPRTRVPAGSVAIANGLCVIYPWVSPGGWHILGRCPLPLFDPARDCPALLAAGDIVRFREVDAGECAAIAAEITAGRRDPADFSAGPP